jgi:methylthioribose-1-phosphate isomerase
MDIKTIEWKNNSIKLIDQTLLPVEFKHIYIKNIKELWQAIKLLKVRGAPALGAAAGLGVYLAIKDFRGDKPLLFKNELERVIKYIGSSRPTARNLFWGLERIRGTAKLYFSKPVSYIKKMILAEALKIIEEDKIACRAIGSYGAGLIRNNDAILTICNAGILATIDYGTALGVIYRAQEKGKQIKVYACETRPILQGARLTTWELTKKGIDVTLICDNMAASLMKAGRVDKVIAGADRITANGDTANKIGTYMLAVLSKYHRIPFYIAAPGSTFDLSLESGRQIPIEERGEEEVTELHYKKRMAPVGVKVFNPSFDVTPHALITAIITDKGIIYPPYKENIARLIGP